MAPKQKMIATNLDNMLKEFYADIWAELSAKNVTGTELCDYVTWSYFNAVPLKGDDARQKQYKDLVHKTCPQSLYDPTTMAVLGISQKNQNLLSSSFLANIRDKVNLAVSKSENAADLPLALTNYQALSEDILLAIAQQALTGVDAGRKLPASSSLIFEVGADQTIRGYLNDMEHVPVGCQPKQPCTADMFVAALNARILTDDVAAACSVTEEIDPFIQA